MFVAEGRIGWSASDVSAAAECEYALLRQLDYRLGRATPIDAREDPLLEHIARLGDRHEAEVLAQMERHTTVIRLSHTAPPLTHEARTEAAATTLEVLESSEAAGAVVVYQAAFYDGEFFGYADFLELTPDGWRVCDAKLAREAKPRALLQLGGYAAQLAKLGVPVAPTVSLLLGDGRREDFRTSDVLPVFREREAALRGLLTAHAGGGSPVSWGDDGGVVACGRCAECEHAATLANDLVLVAGMRMDQRRRLRAAGIRTLEDLAGAEAADRPDGMTPAVFEKLRAQAALQWRQLSGGPDAPVEYELVEAAPATLALLPAPSAGDLFFDFEGDPMYHEGDPTRIGLEYLWGIMDTAGDYRALWAHSRAGERWAFEQFMQIVAERRAKHPDMHIYHYAAYEISALKRIAMRYQVLEKELDDLLRSEVFVDLYATVKGAVRVSTRSYSIKKLEPLYMGEHLRSDDEGSVAGGADSVVAYHEFREMRGRAPEEAAARLASLEDYNAYDCLSTLRLRDWLLERAAEAGVADRVVAREIAIEGEELSSEDPVFVQLMARSGPADRSERTAKQQAFTMLATAIDYNRRERKSFWWDHFERLQHPVEEWRETRDVFVVESAEVMEEWAKPADRPRARNLQRVVRLVGDWAPGSKDGQSQVVYAAPFPPRVSGPESAPYGAGSAAAIETDPANPRVVELRESRPADEVFSDLPVALVPAAPPGTQQIDEAIYGIAAAAAEAERLPESAALDVLARRPPRLRGATGGEPRAADGYVPAGASSSGGLLSGPTTTRLPAEGTTLENVIAALTSMDHSYVAVQGPPGSGKTYIGSRVIRALVERHGWRIGVVAQSHAVVENMLGAVVRAGLDPARVGKSDNKSADVSWTELPDGNVEARAAFVSAGRGGGCVLGGTAWTFANPKLVEPDGLDLLVVDEAGQFSLAPTLAVSVAAKRLLLLGDPQQLPQVSQGSHAEPVDESALGWLVDGRQTLPVELGYFLEESYRMRPELSEKVSMLSYEGRLGSAAAAGRREISGVRPGLDVVVLEHFGNRTESEEEAAEVVAQVREHLGLEWVDGSGSGSGSGSGGASRPLEQRDFVVVAPYNAQVNLIQRALARAGFGGVRVGTVDKFQGQEAPIAIVSMTASSHGDVPRGMGFVLNRNRTNVAVSRAQYKAILIRSRALTAYMPATAEGVLELGTFIGLCS